MESTYVMIKPDGIKRGLAGELISRLEKKELVMEEGRLLRLSRQQAETHYQEHSSKPFFDEMITYICSGPVLAMVWRGENAIAIVRHLVGHRDPIQAAPGTIRGDFAYTITENLIHAADGPESAAREIDLFFGRQQ